MDSLAEQGAQTPPPSQPKHQLFVLEDAVVLQMSQQERYLSAFPFLRNLKSVQEKIPKVGCTRCAQRAHANQVRTALAEAKRNLAEMPDAKKFELKQMLSARQVRVYYAANSQGVIRTF